MVNSQYKLVTQIFGIKHLFAAVGGSLGAMQVLEWSVAYPEFIKQDSFLCRYTPRMSTYDLLWMNVPIKHN